MAARNYGQYCGVVTAVELVGERWALLIIRDLLVGPRRYTDLKAGLPRIPTNILSTRLKELQEAGIIRRVPLMNCGLVYELTEFGQGLDDIVLALGRWGFQAMGDPEEGDIVTEDSMTMAFRTAFRADAAVRLPETTYTVHVGDVALSLHVSPVSGLTVSGLTVLPASAPGVPAPVADVTIAAGPGIRSVISGELTPDEAVSQGVLHVMEGDAGLLGRFAETFHIEVDARIGGRGVGHERALAGVE